MLLSVPQQKRFPHGLREVIKIVIDVSLYLSSVMLVAFAVHGHGQGLRTGLGLLSNAFSLPILVVLSYVFQTYRYSWRHTSLRDVEMLGFVAFSCGVTAWMISFLVPTPRAVILLAPPIHFLFVTFARFFVRRNHERLLRRHNPLDATSGAKAKRTLIVGHNPTAVSLAKELSLSPRSAKIVVGFLDKTKRRHHTLVNGISVLGSFEDLPTLAATHHVDELIIVASQVQPEMLRTIIRWSQELKIPHVICPDLKAVASGNVEVSLLRPMRIEDLLRRPPIQINQGAISKILSGKPILITGAGGSIGSELVRQISNFEPSVIILLGRGENSIYEIHQEMQRSRPNQRFVCEIGDVRNKAFIKRTLKTYGCKAVFHAAAHKHVPLMEHNPEEAVLNNIFGTKNVADACLEHGVETFINISTDKAINPTSVMGACKRIAEYVVTKASEEAASNQCFSSVRFGNVLGSRGSVIPLFREQIRQGGPVTITHRDMKRYFMTIPEASQLVLEAASLRDNGSVNVLDMGEPVKIYDLACDLIRLSGYEPHQDIHITEIGIRPGEKLFEELLSEQEGSDQTKHEYIFRSRCDTVPRLTLDEQLAHLELAAVNGQKNEIKRVIHKLVPTFMSVHSPNEIAL